MAAGRRRRLRRLLFRSGALDLFAELAHVVKGPTRGSFCDHLALVAGAIGVIANRGWRRFFAESHVRGFL
jgi:hypothetical protein